MSLEVTDLFAGAGGSSSGMIQVPGVRVKVAANHWPIAIDIHNRNHQDTDHAAVDLHEEDPRYFPRTDVLWASPECTKWSQASGKKYAGISMEATLLDDDLMEDPLSDAAKRSRLLMFDVLRFIEHHRYRLVFIENVVDIATQAKYRYAWKVWQKGLRDLGYAFRVMSINSMHAQAFGAPAPQSRDRLYIAAWPATEAAPDFERILRPRAYCPKCDEMIEAQQAWKNGKKVGKYRTQYVYIHGACATIVEPGYLPAAAAIDWSDLGTPIGDRLAEKTRLRIAAGIARYWGQPFHLEASGNQYDAADPKHPQHGDPGAYYRAWSMDDTMKTLHCRETKALAVPCGGTWNDEAIQLGAPMRTVTTRETTGLVPFISEFYGTAIGRTTDQPAGTFTAKGNHHGLVTPYYGNSDYGKPADQPIGALTTRDRYALVTRHNGSKSTGAEMTTEVMDYMRTLTTSAQQSITSHPTRPTAKDIEAAMRIVPECNFRMFKHLEVAAGQAFAPDYVWEYDPGTYKNGKPRKVSDAELTKATGNAVPPPNARDLMAIGAEYLGAS